MGIWECLPVEVIAEIYSYLPRRDRLSCSMVCQSWKEALHTPRLWKNVVVCLDTDLNEPSTVMATRQFCKYFESMEFCWTNPQIPSRWMQQRFQELSKRACRFIMILDECLVQLRSIKLIDWYDVQKFKKVVYHLCRFIRSQVSLTRICFFNANFNKTECIKLLASCLESERMVRYLDISSCFHPHQPMYENITFLSCIERFSRLEVLKLDYAYLASGIIDAVITSKNTSLRYLDVFIREYDTLHRVILDDEWERFHRQCPNLGVAYHLRNICHFDDIQYLLQENIPMTCFSMFSARVWDQSKSRNYRKTLSLLLKNYRKSLESLNLQIWYNREILDDLIISIVKRCTKLAFFKFHGIIENMEVVSELCKLPDYSKESAVFKHLHLQTKHLTLENHITLSAIHKDFKSRSEELDIDFQIFNSPGRNMVHVYY